MKRQFQAFSYNISNKSEEELDLFIDGQVVDAETQEVLKAYFGDETSVSYKSFRDQILKKKPKYLNIYINSPGGLITDAMAMHDFIKDQINNGVKVKTEGRGIVASAATFILMAAGENSALSENSWFMIHNVQGAVYGDVNTVEQYSRTMRKFNDQAAGFYSNMTGISETVIGNMMDDETFMTAKEAQEKGFVAKVTAKAEIKNKINPEQWPFQNTAILNLYNEAVGISEATEDKEDRRSFFTSIKSDFMKLFDEMKSHFASAKTDEKFKDVPGREAIVDFVEQLMTPLVNKIDEAIEEPVLTIDLGGKTDNTETVVVSENGSITVSPNTPLLDARDEQIKKLENEMAELRNSLAQKVTTPVREVAGKHSKMAQLFKVELESY